MHGDAVGLRASWSAPFHAIADAVACPECLREVEPGRGQVRCVNCHTVYPIVNGVLDMQPKARIDRGDAEAWAEHWADDHQKSLAQRFFSFYRKAVFARVVAYFVDRFLPRDGLLVEAGSGTSETSMRVAKASGRTLVALDLVRPVLERCHPIMDVRLCGDIFRLPLQSQSIDGIWNVGVMEHFTHDQIDEILREFHRVLRPGARIVLLWPGTDSLPQRMLRVAEALVRVVKRQPGFRFHPEEISQLNSVAQGRRVLARNGFDTVHADPGFRSLFAFKVMVGVVRAASPAGAH